jgi:hypothetical protein
MLTSREKGPRKSKVTGSPETVRSDERKKKVEQKPMERKLKGNLQGSHERLGNPHDKSPLGMAVNFKVAEVMSVVDTGSQFTCIRRDVMNTLMKKGLRVQKQLCHISYKVADGSRCEIKEAGLIHFNVGLYSWDFQFKILERGPYKVLFGLDFLTAAQMVVDIANSTILQLILLIKGSLRK